MDGNRGHCVETTGELYYYYDLTQDGQAVLLAPVASPDVIHAKLV